MSATRKGDYAGSGRGSGPPTSASSSYLLDKGALEASDEESERELMDRWDQGGFGIWLGSYVDIFFTDEANATVREFLHDRIREKVARPGDGRAADPEGLPVRLQARPARLRLLRDLQPAERAPGRREAQPDRGDHPEPGCVSTDGTEYEFDAIVFATGFDAMTGPLNEIDIRGPGGRRCGTSGPTARAPTSG